MPADLNGYWRMISNDNFEEYLKALDVNVAIRKIATLLKPDKDITHEGDRITIKTLSTFKNYNMDFEVGKEFEEDLSGVDDRKCMTTISWDGDRLVCVQKGEIEGRGWTHWVTGDELHLILILLQGKIAISLSQTKVVTQHGDTHLTFKTLSTFRTMSTPFTVGRGSLTSSPRDWDNRHVKSLVTWDGDKLVCTQKGEKANRGWKHWLEGDKLYLVGVNV
ncbi:hypothetical protein CRUP_030729 [Coryphaenoides rupestris]|nr:hypothetical protein CRUP_030729 [Coryphaenoides rupestris]